eukprot:TRINITY_DN8873_c0_g1_i6.p1 TRINITY_DN8873_c0_g1~~TRINITY_DN8873_c0_g1_i6.p1  ORF type:complete len:226 (+),score=48.98 TRINITY_DN8873_c0_g1_i6:120-797(+)
MSSKRQLLASATQCKRFYLFHLKTLIDMLTSAISSLQRTNAKLEVAFNKSQQTYVSLGVEEVTKSVLEVNSAIESKSVYSIHGKHLYTVKMGINKRNEVLAHLNMMLMKLNANSRQSPNLDFKFSTESELLFQFSKIFPAKLFESPLFKRISNELWKSCIVFGYKRKDNAEMQQLFRERLNLYAQGLYEISKQPCNYFLHKAVIDNNLSLLQQLCAGQRYFAGSW